MTIVPAIAQLGEPILRSQAEAINDLGDPKIIELIDSLIAIKESISSIIFGSPRSFIASAWLLRIGSPSWAIAGTIVM